MKKTLVAAILTTAFIAVACAVFGHWLHVQQYKGVIGYYERDREQRMDSIYLSAEASIEAPIDYAIVHLLVEQRNPTNPAVAKRQSDQDIRAIITRCGEISIDAKDVDGSEVFVGPETQWNDEKRTDERIGYIARRSVRIRLEETKKLDRLLSSLSTTPSVTIKGVAFRTADTEGAYYSAFRNAVSNATDRARQLVEAAGYELGAMTSISDERDALIMYLRAAPSDQSAEIDEGTSFTSETITISAKAEVRFAVEDPEDDNREPNKTNGE